MATPPGADRTKALRLRKKLAAGAGCTPEEVAWLNDYEKARDHAQIPRDVGASAARSRKVSYTEEEQEAAAVGTGTAAEMAAAGMMVREEGRREDSLARIALEAYGNMVKAMLAERAEDAKTHRKLLSALTQNILTNANLQASAILDQAERDAEDKPDELTKLAEQLLPIIGPMMGFPTPAPAGKKSS